MIELILGGFKESVMITVFVFVMMMIIDYFNTLSRGAFGKLVKGKGRLQYVITAFLGVTPGCLGAFLNVSFYMRGLVTFGAVAAGMIATSGDEAFVMLFARGMIPFSVLLASSIVQDGHGRLPLYSFSVRDALLMKLFTLVIGLALGFGLFLAGL